jgi:hypothetical protein
MLPSRTGSTHMGIGGNAALVDLKPTCPNPNLSSRLRQQSCLIIIGKRLYYKLNPRTEERYK